jgi:diacylglycerol O-acyltransferase
MQQLTAMDSIFLTQETVQAPMHIGLLMFYAPSASSESVVRFKDILATFRARAQAAPVYHRELREVPLGIDYPYWVDAPKLDIEFHVRHLALPKPGDWRQLCIQVARLHARLLDRRKPLWEATVIEGLDNIDFLPRGSFAILFKFHHAAVDGISGLEAIRVLHESFPRPGPAPKDAESPAAAERAPGELELFARSYVNRLRSPARWLKAAQDIAPLIRRVRKGNRDELFHANRQRQNTRFNGLISAHRVVEARFFDLDTVKQMKRCIEGATVNDVMVTVIAGAMRKYLLDKEELPLISPVALVPVSFRDSTEMQDGGNLVTAMTMPIHSEIEDPLQRLQAVLDESRSSKAYTAAIGTRTSVDFSQVIPPALASMVKLRTGVQLLQASGASAPVNTVITNVPGPREPLYLCGAEMVAASGFGPIMDSVGLFHAILSCNGSLSIAINACRKMLPDPGFYAECIQDSFDELHAATTSAG